MYESNIQLSTLKKEANNQLTITFSVISFKICIVHILLKGYAYHQNRDHFG